MKDKILWIILVLVIAGVGFAGLSIVGCRTFKPIWIDQLPAECNLMLNTYKLYYNAKEKSATVPSSIYCYKKIRRLSCREQVFGLDKDGYPNKVDYQDFTPYKEFNSCMSELR